MGWFSFSGKIGRGAFLFRLCFCAVTAGALFSYVINEPQTLTLWKWCGAVAGVLLWILTAASVQRFRDLHISFWYLFFLLVPVANACIVFALIMVEGGFTPEPQQRKEYEIDESFVPPEEYPEQTDESFDRRLTHADLPEGWRWNNGPAWIYKPAPVPLPSEPKPEPEPESEIDDGVYRKMGLKPPKRKR